MRRLELCSTSQRRREPRRSPLAKLLVSSYPRTMWATFFKSVGKILLIISPLLVGIFSKYSFVEAPARYFGLDAAQTKEIVKSTFVEIACILWEDAFALFGGKLTKKE